MINVQKMRFAIVFARATQAYEFHDSLLVTVSSHSLSRQRESHVMLDISLRAAPTYR